MKRSFSLYGNSTTKSPFDIPDIEKESFLVNIFINPLMNEKGTRMGGSVKRAKMWP